MSTRSIPRGHLCRATAFVALLIAGPAFSANHESLGSLSRNSVPTPATPANDCPVPFHIHGDGAYDDGYAWRSGGQVAPYYGAFAESFQGSQMVCSVVLDLTQLGAYDNQPADIYLWNNVNEGGTDKPSEVVALFPNQQLGPISTYPDFSRHVVVLGSEQAMDGRWWVGYWGHWPGTVNSWFIAADRDLGFSHGYPMTNIVPGIGWPGGWQSVEIVWGETNALGIGVLSQAITSSVPVDGVQITTFGRVKSLFQ